MNNYDDDIINNFVTETKENLEIVEKKLLAIEQDSSFDTLNALFRAVHSVKGAAGFLEYKSIETLSHLAENVLGKIRDSQIGISDSIVTLLLQCNDRLKQMMETNDFGESSDTSDLVKQFSILLDVTQLNSTQQSDNIPHFNPNPSSSDISSSETDIVSTKSTDQFPGKEFGGSQKKHNQPSQSTIRIGVRVLDELLNHIGEVVLGRNQIITKFAGDPSFSTLSQSITKLHQYVIQTRMQPIGTLFERYTRTVRDLSAKLNKKIDLHLEGNEIELDRTIIEALADPLVHLIRNALDHGIEVLEERSRSGKSIVGNIYLRALHESGQILIEVEDDGRGIDTNRVKAKAIEKGIINQEKSEQITEKELIELIFHPGFSTNDNVTEISGRGVGMDVVKSNLEKLGCMVEIMSRKGKGTIVSARIPLTLAIVNSSVISAIIISIGNYTLAIPQLAVNEIIRLSPDEQQKRIERIKGQEVFKLRDKIIPLVHLEDLLNIPRTYFDPIKNTFGKDKREYITTDDKEIRDRRKQCAIFIVLQYKQNFFGVLVDHIQGTEEIVVKRMPMLLKNRKVFAGSTILGNGTVALILDINGMVEIANLDFFKKQESSHVQFNKKIIKEDSQKIVIFNNAINEYFALPVNLLSEVDRFSVSEVHRSGPREFIHRHGESVPLLRLEKQLNVSPIESNKKSYTVIIPSRVKYPTGIICNRIITTSLLTEAINTKEADGKGVMGTLFIDNKLIMLLDIYTLLQHSDPERYKDIVEENVQSVRLLIVEDQLFFRQLVSQYFKNYGIKNIHVACNGEEALDFLYKNTSLIDIVISDIEMPVMDGYQLVASIKSNPQFSHIPVMALTTLGSHENIQKGMEAGFDAYEIKIDKDKVLKSLCSLYKKCKHLSAEHH
jgi:two-component system chemotaxis sensor kinase CheA